MFLRLPQLLALATLLSPLAAGAQVTLDITVSTGNDDAFEDSGGDLKLSDDKLELGKHPFAGTRFRNVTIPQGATITNAYVRFTSTSDESSDIDVDILAEDVDNAGSFSGDYYLTNRTPTTACVNWTTSNWTEDTTEDTPDIRQVVQEVVDRAGWSSGASITILFRSNDTNYQQFAWARDYGSTDAPVLHIEYDTSIVRPELLFLTADSTPNAGEKEEIAQIQAWGYRVVTLEDGSSQAAYDAAAATADVIFIGEGVNSGSVGHKLRTTPVGVVVSERNSYDEMGFATTLGQEYSGDSLTVVDNSHPITSGFALGDVAFVSPSATLSKTNGSLAPGIRGLTERFGHYGIFVLERGDQLVDTHSGNSTASGRRVGVPLGSPSLSWTTLTADGLELIRRAFEWARVSNLEFGLAGHWKFDDGAGTTAVDSSENRRDGTLVGAPTWETDGQINGALAFTADANDRVELPASVLAGAGNTTIAVWVRAESSANRRVYFSGANASNSNEILLGVSDTTVSVYNGESASSSGRLVWNLPHSIAGSWNHLTVVRDQLEQEISLYLNGELVGTQSTTLNYLTIDSGGLVVGEDQDSVGGGFQSSDSFVGSLDDLRVYRTALTPSTIAELYGLIGHWRLNETSGVTAVDSSGLANDGAYANGVTLNQPGPYPGAGAIAASLDGTNDQIQVPHHEAYNPDEAVSIALWVKRGDVAWWDTLVSKGKYGNPPYILAWTDDGRLTFKANITNVTSSGSVAKDTWTHVAVTFDEQEVRFYVNGRLDSTRTMAAELTTDSTLELNIGSAEFNTGYAEGDLFDVRLYNRVISQDEITHLYGLTGHWKFDEGAGTTIADSSGLANDATFSAGSPTWVDGIRRSGLEFDGSSDARTSGEFTPSERGAVALWFRSDGPPPSRQRLWGLGADYEMWQDQDGLVSMDVSTDGFQGGFITTEALHTEGQWYHVVAQYDSSDDSYEIYLDGKLHKAGVSTWDITLQEANFLSFGTRTGSLQRFTGALDDFRIYNRWLSPAEIASLYGLVGHYELNETSGLVAADSSGAGNDADYIGAPTLGVSSTGSPALGTAVSFNGSNYVETTVNALGYAESGSLAGWANLTTPDTFGSEIVSVSDHLGLRIDDTGVLRGFIYNGSTFESVTTPLGLAGSGWRHYAVTYDAETSELSLYVDGVLEATQTTSGALVTTGLAGATRIGSHGGTHTLFDFEGRLDDIRIYNRPISPDEVRGLFFDQFVPGPRIVGWREMPNP